MLRLVKIKSANLSHLENWIVATCQLRLNKKYLLNTETRVKMKKIWCNVQGDGSLLEPTTRCLPSHAIISFSFIMSHYNNTHCASFRHKPTYEELSWDRQTTRCHCKAKTFTASMHSFTNNRKLRLLCVHSWNCVRQLPFAAVLSTGYCLPHTKLSPRFNELYSIIFARTNRNDGF